MILSITGTGAVSPAGWGVQPMMKMLDSNKEPAISLLERPLHHTTIATPVLRVPSENSTTPKITRLRRTSPISKFAAAAAMEALGEIRLTAIAARELRVGIIFTLINGCVGYSNRFFSEVLSDPKVASPILFPETVFNAPSSHLSAMIGSAAPNDTLIADSTGFFSGMDLAAEWIMRGDVDGCLIVASEELDWLSAEGLQLYSKNYLPSEGAGAIYLEATDDLVKLQHLPDPISFTNRTRTAAAREIRKTLAIGNHVTHLLIDGRAGIHHPDLPETLAWQDWTATRWSPRKILGEAMGASVSWQVIAAVEALRSKRYSQVAVTAVGGNQQAAGCLLGH